MIELRGARAGSPESDGSDRERREDRPRPRQHPVPDRARFQVACAVLASRLHLGTRSMNRDPGHAAEPDGERGFVALALLALAVGAAAGLVGAIFRAALEHADRWRDAL